MIANEKTICMGSTTANGLLENGVGVHFSGLHLDNPETRDHKSPNFVAANDYREPFVIGVAGGAAAGKTAVCDMIIGQLHDQRVVVVNQESFYHNLTEEEANRVHEYNFDHPGGNSAVQAISLLLQKGVHESNIIFLNLISAPQGVHVVCKRFPRIKIVTSEIEFGLSEDFRVVPVMGEFGDRYFGTDDN